jgi:hypothetical protein
MNTILSYAASLILGVVIGVALSAYVLSVNCYEQFNSTVPHVSLVCPAD